MIDISAVQASHGIAEIMEMVEKAQQYGFISIHTLPCWVGHVRRLIPETNGIRVGGPIGFPAHLQSVFKLMWYRDHEPELFSNIDKLLEAKDYISFKMTGELVTDYSYASGCDVYDLKAWNYCPDLVEASSIPSRIFPEIVPSTQIIGRLTPEAAEALGLPPSVQVLPVW